MTKAYIDIRFEATLETETLGDETYVNVAKLTPKVKKVNGLFRDDLMSIGESMGQMDSWQEMLANDVPNAIWDHMEEMDA